MSFSRARLLLAAGVAAAWCAAAPTATGFAVTVQRPAVRLALVNVPDELVRVLLPEFEKQHAIAASIVYTGNDPFAEGRKGNADVVIAHFGHDGVEPFVRSRFGRWPKAVFSNQMTLIGPSSDPARVRGVRSLSDALRRIADSESPYVSNASAGARYIEDIAAAGAARRPRSIESGGAENAAAVKIAADRGGYVLWGLPPFLRWKRQQPIEQATDLEPLVIDDPLLQRMMVTIVVDPEAVKGVNAEAATRFQSFLLSPATQGRIAAFRYPDFDRQVWWPAGRHNSSRE